jgi:hypothetical protein
MEPVCWNLHWWCALNDQLNKRFCYTCQRKNHDVIKTHCFLQCLVLVSKMTGEDLKQVLHVAVSMVNFINTAPSQIMHICKAVWKYVKRPCHSPSTHTSFYFNKKIISCHLSNSSEKILLQFSTSYLCQQAFLYLTKIKHKQRNCLLCVKEELRTCLPKIWPRIQHLCKRKEAQVSH